MPSFRASNPTGESDLPKNVRPFLSEDEWRDRRRPEPIGEVVDRIMTGVAGGRAGAAVVLGARWAEVVGDDFAAKTAPGSCESGRLVILVSDGSTASKMRFNTSQILQNAAKIAGEGRVESISFRVSPSLSKKPTA
ncbi:MAG: DUF721 domain-containing protein [Acidimicrobiia bacterium]|nr:DUF721 domain-containing protein [Acidimicrobiia bacterium]